MIDLKQVTKGRIQLPPRVILGGFDGVGKSSAAAGAPDPFFLDVDRGTNQLDVRRVTPGSWDETLEWIAAVATGKVECKTLVLDTLTKLEQMQHDKLFVGTTIDAYEDGYGRGDTYVLGFWKELLVQLERVWMSGKGIVLLSQVTVKAFNDPTGPGYDRYELALRPKTAGLLKQWADYVFFCREEVVIAREKGGKKSKATTTGVRYAYTKRTPAYDAKARGTTMFPERILLSWDAFDKSAKDDAGRAEESRKGIAEALEEIGDAAFTKQVNDWVKEHPEGIVDAYNSVAARLDAFRKAQVAT